MQLDHLTVSDNSSVVSKAFLRAAELLRINNSDLSKIIGLSPATLSRMINQKSAISETGKEFQLALLFIRLYRSLDTIMGGDDAVSASWLRNFNTVIHDIPLERIKKVEGLVDVVTYLDSRRAKV